MTREHRLKFCKKCDNQGFDLKRGIICNLTNERADFVGSCPDFTGDVKTVESIVAVDQHSDMQQACQSRTKENLKTNNSNHIAIILIGICTVVYISMVISGINPLLPDLESLLQWGANYKPLTLKGEQWRLITSIFLHFGIFHLVANMAMLYFVGKILEPIIGWLRILLAFLISGLTGSIVSLWWHNNTISAGASGAIFGLLGVYIIFQILTKKNRKIDKQLLIATILVVIINLVNGINTEIDNAAHLGGLIGGIIIGISYIPFFDDKKKRNYEATEGAIYILLIGLVVFYFLSAGSNPVGKYNDIMEEIQHLESEALNVINYPDFETEGKFVDALEEVGINNWRKCRQLNKSILDIKNIPKELTVNNHILDKYFLYRIMSLRIMVESIVEMDPRILRNIEPYERRIELIMNKLAGDSVNLALLDEPVVMQPLNEDQEFFPLRNEIQYFVDGAKVKSFDHISPENIYFAGFVDQEHSFDLFGMEAPDGAMLLTTVDQYNRIISGESEIRVEEVGSGKCSIDILGYPAETEVPPGLRLPRRITILDPSLEIEGVLKNRFGVSYRVLTDKPMFVELSTEWVFPTEMVDNEGHSKITAVSKGITLSNTTSWAAYRFDEEYEILVGMWKFRIYFDNNIIYEKSFEVF